MPAACAFGRGGVVSGHELRMKQQELDPTNEVDAGWDDVDVPSAVPAAAATPSKPLSLAPPSGATDELDEGWDDEDSEEPVAAVVEAADRAAPAGAEAAAGSA